MSYDEDRVRELARTAIDRQTDGEPLYYAVETPRNVDKSGYRERIDDWIREVRADRGQWK